MAYRLLIKYIKSLLFVGAILLLTWIAVKRSTRGGNKAHNLYMKYPATEAKAWGEEVKRAGTEKLQREHNKFNGLIRINIGGILSHSVPEKLNIDKRVERSDITEKNKNMLKRNEERAASREKDTAVTLISKIRPSTAGVIFERTLQARAVKVDVTMASNTPVRVYPNGSQASSKFNRNLYSNATEASEQEIQPFPSSSPERTLTSKQDGKLEQTYGRNNEEQKLVRGYLNLHVWFDICSSSLDSLRNFLLFPIAPDFRGNASRLSITLKRKKYGLRLFGYLRPLTTDSYWFSILSTGSVELWLSSDRNSEKLQMIARKTASDAAKDSHGEGSNNSDRDVSLPVKLKADELYFIEILHKHGESSDDHLGILWRNSSMEMSSAIPGSSLIGIRDDSLRKTKYQYTDIRIRSLAREDTVMNQQFFDRKSRTESGEDLGDHIVNEVLQPCEYKPSYLIHYKLVRFQGARNKKNTRFVEIYPPDSSNESLPLVESGGRWWTENALGNKVLDSTMAISIVKSFMGDLERKHPKKYQLQEVVNVKSTQDKLKGVRFFLDLKIQEKATNSTKFLKRYVFRRKDITTLCFPRNFRWNPQAVVHVIVPVKSSSTWVLAAVKNFEEILSSSGYRKINLVVVDYGSQDMDIKQLLQDSNIKTFQVVSLTQNQPFRRAVALQAAANAIRDPHGILFFCDLHLSIPTNLFTIVRQHCVEGKMAFAPVVKRLRCGSYPSSPFGYWENLGFGLFAIYKSDFDRIGGMDVETFKEWGGEDWELLDRVLMSGMEVERLKIPAFYHFYHPPFGSPNSRTNF